MRFAWKNVSLAAIGLSVVANSGLCAPVISRTGGADLMEARGAPGLPLPVFAFSGPTPATADPRPAPVDTSSLYGSDDEEDSVPPDTNPEPEPVFAFSAPTPATAKRPSPAAVDTSSLFGSDVEEEPVLPKKVAKRVKASRAGSSAATKIPRRRPADAGPSNPLAGNSGQGAAPATDKIICDVCKLVNNPKRKEHSTHWWCSNKCPDSVHYSKPLVTAHCEEPCINVVGRMPKPVPFLPEENPDVVVVRPSRQRACLICKKKRRGREFWDHSRHWQCNACGESTISHSEVDVKNHVNALCPNGGKVAEVITVDED